MSKNEINFYYKGANQKIKYYGKLDENAIKSTAKRIFKISESLEQIYIQDEDGDILILNDQTPSGISVHLFVEPDPIPKNPSTALNIPISTENLIKFHWIIDKVNDDDNSTDYNLDVIINKYTYTTVHDSYTHPPARSNCTFENGRHFLVLRKTCFNYYSMITVSDENKKNLFQNEGDVGIFGDVEEENNFTENLGILIDMDKKKCIFYDYDKKQKKRIQYIKCDTTILKEFEAPIIFNKVKIYV